MLETKILESVIVVAVFLVIRFVINQFIRKAAAGRVIQNSRTLLVKKAINFILLVLGFVTLTVIWGVDQSELAVFIGSTLTIIGVALVAQWSLLSNITSSIIIFFVHSVKIGDAISIMESKDYEIRGEVLNIGLFFTKIKVFESDDEISLPNNIFIIKTIRKINTPIQELDNSDGTLDQED